MNRTPDDLDFAIANALIVLGRAILEIRGHLPIAQQHQMTPIVDEMVAATKKLSEAFGVKRAG